MVPVHLDRNENRYGPAPGCRRALDDLDPELLGTYARDGSPAGTLAARLAALHGVETRRVLLGYGCEDLLERVVRARLRPGEACLVPSPSWTSYRALIEAVAGVMVEYPLRETVRTYAYDLDALLDAQRASDARLLIIGSPNNPTGNAFPLGELAALLDRLPDVTVVLDQAYWGFAEEVELDPARLLGRHPNLPVLRSFSKLYALAGARIGYGLAGDGLARFRDDAVRRLGFSRVLERLVVAALDDPDYYATIRDHIVADRRRILDRLSARAGIRAYESAANFVLARFPAGVVTPLIAALAARDLIVKRFEEPMLADCARFTVGTAEETSRLATALDEMLDARR